MTDYERLDAYQRSIEFVALAAQAVGELPADHEGLRDQFRRAAMSIPLNIAEASGRVGSADRARFHCSSMWPRSRISSCMAARTTSQAPWSLSRQK